MTKIFLYEILVPTTFEDTKTPVRLRHHKEWDKVVKKVSGGLSIFRPIKGVWISSVDGKEIVDRMIPVRFTSTKNQALKILDFTKLHYRQICCMMYKISDEVIIR